MNKSFKLELVHELHETREALDAAVNVKIDDLRELDSKSYAITKKWTRNSKSEKALSHLKDVQAINY